MYGCLDECPKVICVDVCRVEYEKCFKNGETMCEHEQEICLSLCDNIPTVQREEFWNIFSVKSSNHYMLVIEIFSILFAYYVQFQIVY